MYCLYPYEQGPIRPPSEAHSLLIRVTRNCPWNQCAFCPVYKDHKFQRRSVEEVKGDIVRAAQFFGPNINLIRSAFLQDADTVIIKAQELVEIISFVKAKFPFLERITSYGRGKTLAKKEVADLKQLKEAGLSRIHMGLETGYDPLLAYMRKGATAHEMITAGKRVVESGISLSLYVILGLGGKKWWPEHARETARVINQINPHFIRVRTLRIPEGTPLQQKAQTGEFIPLTDQEVALEERLLIESLTDINSYFASDHILNLLEEIEGQLPGAKPWMLNVIDRFLQLPEEEKLNFIMGRRGGAYRSLDDLDNELLHQRIAGAIDRLRQEGPDRIEEALQLLMERML
ncbi:MAG: hypothetical protein A3G93_07165 [Nitrospinae bacterium RIFCSPLOWO2_12_FULL_45_22]|nr:MAG: hypothetical protein A3G93_07165 [Nitrospinae bacterium RIFCSPLOWO2_12_FULL_45_22]